MNGVVISYHCSCCQPPGVLPSVDLSPMSRLLIVARTPPPPAAPVPSDTDLELTTPLATDGVTEDELSLADATDELFPLIRRWNTRFNRLMPNSGARLLGRDAPLPLCSSRNCRSAAMRSSPDVRCAISK